MVTSIILSCSIVMMLFVMMLFVVINFPHCDNVLILLALTFMARYLHDNDMKMLNNIHKTDICFLLVVTVLSNYSQIVFV